MILVWCGVSITLVLLVVRLTRMNPILSCCRWYTNSEKSRVQVVSIYIHPYTDQPIMNTNTYHEVTGFTFNPSYLTDRVDVDHFVAYVRVLVNEAFIIHEMISIDMKVYISPPVSHLPAINTTRMHTLPSTNMEFGAVNITAFAQSTRLTIRICAQTGCAILDIFSFGIKPNPSNDILSYISDSMRHSYYFPNHTTSSVVKKLK
jgi:hypothetical protein